MALRCAASIKWGSLPEPVFHLDVVGPCTQYSTKVWRVPPPLTLHRVRKECPPAARPTTG